MRIGDFDENADGGNGLLVGWIWLRGTLNFKWRKMSDHLYHIVGITWVNSKALFQLYAALYDMCYISRKARGVHKKTNPYKGIWPVFKAWLK